MSFTIKQASVFNFILLMFETAEATPETVDHSHKKKKSTTSRIRPKKKTSERLLSHFARLKELSTQQEQELVEQTSSQTSGSTIDVASHSERIDFEKSIEMEYYQLNKEQLEITRAFMHGISIAKIKRDIL